MKTCPDCALELEDSYLFCPEDGASLAEPITNTTGKATFSNAAAHKPRLTSLVLTRPQVDSPRIVPRGTVPPSVNDGLDCNDDIGPGETDLEPSEDVSQKLFENEVAPQGFRIAAIATIIVLAVLALTGLYALISNLSRRPSVASRAASQTETSQAAPFVVTPQEAQDFKEENPPPSHDDSSQAPSIAQAEAQARKQSSSPSSEDRIRKTTMPPPAQTQRAQTPASAVTTSRVSDSQLPESPRVSSAGFDSRLVRARSMRTTSGYRYDLTFNMQEQRGRSAQWQRVLITTRSASGMNHTQALPFVHRLGGTGALTFTISVELTGRSETDWRGRVNCTALGWDNAGAPLQASFLANVAP